MKFIDLAFRLGVVFAIFAFIWGIFQLMLGMMRGLRPKTIVEEYIFKFVNYFFLVDVTFLFCTDQNESILINEIMLTLLILVLYFMGKLQNRQQRINMLNVNGISLPKMSNLFNFKAEVAAIVFAISIFIFFIFYPNFAYNPISNWFYKSILDIETTFFFGFIFRIIGFFVLLGILFKLVNGISFLISGKALASVQSRFYQGKKDDFDDFEEIK